MFTRAGFQFDAARARHNQHIQHVPDTGSAQVGVAEAHDRIVGVVVPGTPVPTLVEGVRTELHHSEGNRGTGVTMAVPARSNLGLDKLRDIVDGSCRRSLNAWHFGL